MLFLPLHFIVKTLTKKNYVQTDSQVLELDSPYCQSIALISDQGQIVAVSQNNSQAQFMHYYELETIPSGST